MYRIASIMWHVLPSVPRIYLCVDDMDALIVVDLITKVVRPKVVQEQDNRFVYVLISTFISILSVASLLGSCYYGRHVTSLPN